MKHFSEEFLHFVWQWRRFDAAALQTTQGEALEILHPGNHNKHAGPDFFNARLKIADTLWAGNVEIHVEASEWLSHGHQRDPAYDNVILHVVWSEDKALYRPNGERIPCLSLENRIPRQILNRWQSLRSERNWIPCAASFHAVPGIIKLNWMDRLLIERLEEKTAAVAQALEQTQGHWEEAFYRAVARNFGLKVNTDPFEMLARSIPVSLLAKHKNSLFQLEALLLGQAGWLEGEFGEEYPRTLAKEYRHLRHKYELEPTAAAQWKFLRLRPANFPMLRVAQFAALIHRSVQLFAAVLDARTTRELELLFNAEPSAYWQDHYRLDKASVKKQRRPGRDFVHLLIINTIVPFLFHYGSVRAKEELRRKALYFLENLPAESNAIIDSWRHLGAETAHSYQTQALIHLKNHYCAVGRCLECAIGHCILK